MKLINNVWMIIVMALFSLSCQPQEPSADSALQDVQDVESMERRADGRYDVLCRDGTREVATVDDILANRVCEIGSGEGSFVYGRSDRCETDDIIAEVFDNTDCSTLSSSERAWSIRVNGECRNISDTYADKACQMIQAETHDVIYSRSDTCDFDDIAVIMNDFTDCSTLSDSTVAWSIKVNGQCRNISDTTVRKACYEIRGEVASAIYGRSDSCDLDDIIGDVSAGTDCNRFSDSERAWSIRVNGQCVNISDTNARSACYEIKQRSGSNFVYGRSDSCEGDDRLVEVDRYTDCSQLSSSEKAWSIFVNGSCQNISDTNVRSACYQIKEQLR